MDWNNDIEHTIASFNGTSSVSEDVIADYEEQRLLEEQWYKEDAEYEESLIAYHIYLEENKYARMDI